MGSLLGGLFGGGGGQAQVPPPRVRRTLPRTLRAGAAAPQEEALKKRRAMAGAGRQGTILGGSLGSPSTATSTIGGGPTLGA